MRVGNLRVGDMSPIPEGLAKQQKNKNKRRRKKTKVVQGPHYLTFLI